MAPRPASADGVVEVTNSSGGGDFILVCEHASRFIPPEFENLGLNDDALHSHIAWDPGALPVALAMSAILDAPVIAPRVSRLVYDCNRSPEANSAMPAESEIHEIPGNKVVSASERRARADRYYRPFHGALADAVKRRTEARRTPVIMTIHSFAPVYDGIRRDLDIGVIHDSDTRFADQLLRIGEAEADLDVRRNAPYGPPDGVTHTLAEHALPRGLLNVMIEIRNDLIATPASQRAMAERLSRYAAEALATLGCSGTEEGPWSKAEPRPLGPDAA